MRAELPWNVAGIPPEAREAARAAARREGLSVGEWLTRRILRSFSAMEEEFQPAPGSGAPLDSWGLPQSAASRRDTEDMLARVSRTETESSDVNRRIEEQLRSVARRLDSAERSQSENNRVMSKTASEINIATREQAQAFDQLGSHVVGLGERIERLERSASQDGLRDAVKALHQGLSRLADQITQTANQSATQVSSVAGSLEQLAVQLGQVRSQAEDADNVLGQRIAAVEKVSQLNYNAMDHARADSEEADKALEQRIAAIEKASQLGSHVLDQARADAEEAAKALEQRIATVERASQVSTNALDHALEKLESQAVIRAGDLAEAQKRDTQTEVTIMRLEESLSRLESKVQDTGLERRLDGIDRSLADLAQRLEHNPATPFEASVRALADRVEALDKKHSDLLAELQSTPAPAAPEQHFETQSTFAVPPFQPAGSFEAPGEPIDFEAPPFVEPQPVSVAPFGAEGFAGAGFHESDPFAGGFAPDSFAAPAFGSPGFEPQQDFASEPAATAENFLSAARRSAQAAAESEAARGNAPFNWRRETAQTEKPRSRLLIPLVITLLIALALAASFVLSQRMKANNALPVMPAPKLAAPVARPPKNLSASPQVAPSQVAVTPAPQVAVTPAPAGNDAATRIVPPPVQKKLVPPPVAAANLSPATPASAPASAGNNPTRTPAPAASQPPAKTAIPGTAPVATPAAGDRVTQLANQGNATAQTILGLKYLDGQGVTADVQEAGKWLLKAAGQNQAVAQYRLGTMYERGQGTAADIAKAAKWYLAAAGQGNRKAMHNLAVAYADGAMGKKDMAEAARWFSRAAALGLSDSQFNLAVLYERGDGVPQSLIDAFKWYAIAAGQGDNESKQRLSVLQTQLSDSDRAAAQKSASAFRAAPLNRAANVPPELSDLPKK